MVEDDGHVCRAATFYSSIGTLSSELARLYFTQQAQCSRRTIVVEEFASYH